MALGSRGSATLAKVWLPARITTAKLPTPQWTPRRRRRVGEHPTDLLEEPIPLLEVVALAARDDVGPVMRPAATTGDHVINGVGERSAIRASVSVPRKHRSAGEWCSCREMRDLDKAAEPHHRRDRDRHTRRVQHHRVRSGLHWLSPVSEEQGGSPAWRDDAQRLVGHVEQQDVGHRTQRSRRILDAHARTSTSSLGDGGVSPSPPDEVSSRNRQ